MMERGFKGVWIPKEVWLSDKLTLQEKVFYVEIDSLDNENGCFASNKHFSKFFGISKTRCSEVINSLEKKGLIKINYIRSVNKTNIEKRVIKVIGKSNTLSEKSKGGIRKVEGGYSENFKESNTSNSNTNNKEHLALFEEWWKLYDNKKDKKKCSNKYKTLLKEYSHEEIMEGTKRYLNHLSTLKRNGEFVPQKKYPHTFLNGENFNDEYRYKNKEVANYGDKYKSDSVNSDEALRILHGGE